MALVRPPNSFQISKEVKEREEKNLIENILQAKKHIQDNTGFGKITITLSKASMIIVDTTMTTKITV